MKVVYATPWEDARDTLQRHTCMMQSVARPSAPMLVRSRLLRCWKLPAGLHAAAWLAACVVCSSADAAVSGQVMHCPRCSHLIRDNVHGICGFCRENAFQVCMLARTIPSQGNSAALGSDTVSWLVKTNPRRA